MGLIGSIRERITKFIDVYTRLLKVNLIGSTAVILSYLMFAMITLFILFCIILFMGFGLAEVFVSAGLPRLAAFFATMGIYILLLVIVFALRKRITKYFSDNIINVVTEQSENEKDKKE